MKRIWRFSEARNIRRYDFEDRSSGDEGFVTVNRCTKACGWTRRFVRVPVLRKCGGDIREYFGRYRRKLHSKEDIRRNPGLSEADLVQLKNR